MSMAMRTRRRAVQAGGRRGTGQVDHNDAHARHAPERRGSRGGAAAVVPDAPGRRRAGRMTGIVQWLLVLAVGAVIVYALFVGGLAIAGRRADARAVAGFIPDCIVLFQRILGDPRTPRRYRAVIVALLGY